MHCLKMHHSSDSSVSFFLRVWFWTQPMACVGGMVISLLLLWVIQTQKLIFFLSPEEPRRDVRCWSQGHPFQRLLFPSSVCMWHLGQRLNPLTQSSIQPQCLSAAGPWLTSVIHTHTHTHMISHFPPTHGHLLPEHIPLMVFLQHVRLDPAVCL